MEKKGTITKLVRIALGLFLILFALNQFFHVLPTSYGEMPERTQDFLDATVNYLPLLYVLEILIGLFLILNKWTSFILIVLFPLSFSFLFFNFLNQDINHLWSALFVACLNILLVAFNFEKYKPLFS